MTAENIMTYETVALDEAAKRLVIIDQTRLPNERVMLSMNAPEDIWRAINTLQVRGAPAIGVAAAIGLYAAAETLTTDNSVEFVAEVRRIKDYLAGARPTAVSYTHLDVYKRQSRSWGSRAFSRYAPPQRRRIPPWCRAAGRRQRSCRKYSRGCRC